MNYKHLIRSLTMIKRRLRPCLESGAEGVIDTAIAGLKKSKADYDKFQKRKDLLKKPFNDWGYEILTPPLRFKVAEYKGYRLRPDIICNFRWQQEGALPTTLELVLRVWSADERLIYREEYDSEAIAELMTSPHNGLQERVMLRCHFDLANPNQSGPRYHLQIGGNPRAREHGWYPKELDLPRLVHQPFDLVLLCELVTANFFPTQYKDIRPKPDWHWAIKTSERYLLEQYYTECLAAVKNKKSTLLSALWNKND
ncbi:MAG: hypothetical protein ACPGWR_15495 [Ardenticatenaceae bacterium]